MMNNKDQVDDGAFVLLDFTGDNLEPAPLLSLLTLPARSKKKGTPLGPTRNGRTPVAKTGYCSFTTYCAILSKMAVSHVELLFQTLESRISAIRDIMDRQELTWAAVLFEGNSDREYFSDLSPALFERADKLGLPILQKEEEAMTIVWDADEGKQSKLC
jgi:hypothetical protein